MQLLDPDAARAKMPMCADHQLHLGRSGIFPRATLFLSPGHDAPLDGSLSRTGRSAAVKIPPTTTSPHLWLIMPALTDPKPPRSSILSGVAVSRSQLTHSNFQSLHCQFRGALATPLSVAPSSPRYINLHVATPSARTMAPMLCIALSASRKAQSTPRDRLISRALSPWYDLLFACLSDCESYGSSLRVGFTDIRLMCSIPRTALNISSSNRPILSCCNRLKLVHFRRGTTPRLSSPSTRGELWCDCKPLHQPRLPVVSHIPLMMLSCSHMYAHTALF